MYYLVSNLAPKKPALEARYNELLKLIAEVGKDIKPSYTNGKGHSDRLRKSEQFPVRLWPTCDMLTDSTDVDSLS